MRQKIKLETKRAPVGGDKPLQMNGGSNEKWN
jgi:hypothetical protein